MEMDTQRKTEPGEFDACFSLASAGPMGELFSILFAPLSFLFTIYSFLRPSAAILPASLRMAAAASSTSDSLISR